MIVRNFLNLKPGHSVTRQYRNSRKVRAFSAVNAVIAIGLGFHHAKNSNKMVFIDMINILIFGKLTEHSHKVMKNLKPEYTQIVNRAKAIFANSKK